MTAAPVAASASIVRARAGFVPGVEGLAARTHPLPVTQVGIAHVGSADHEHRGVGPERRDRRTAAVDAGRVHGDVFAVDGTGGVRRDERAAEPGAVQRDDAVLPLVDVECRADEAADRVAEQQDLRARRMRNGTDIGGAGSSTSQVLVTRPVCPAAERAYVGLGLEPRDRAAATVGSAARSWRNAAALSTAPDGFGDCRRAFRRRQSRSTTECGIGATCVDSTNDTATDSGGGAQRRERACGSQRAVPDRLLEQPVRREREQHAHHDPLREQRPARDPGARGGEHEVHGPVEEIEAVGDEADGDERRECERTRHHAGPRARPPRSPRPSRARRAAADRGTAPVPGRPGATRRTRGTRSRRPRRPRARCGSPVTRRDRASPRTRRARRRAAAPASG